MTTEGPVQGMVEAGVVRFLGIPYAAPPTGARRWRPPEAPPRHRATLDATRFGSICPQVTALGVYAGLASVDENCLTLNIFAPTHASDKLKPVLVWLHGGGHMSGSASDYDAGKLATGGPDGAAMVVVTVNSRLGLLGYLAHPALSGEGHAASNYGLMDVERALRWVRANIRAFGGDPANVTLGGHSSGAALAGALMLAPSAAGLFGKAILQSAPLSTLPPLSAGLARGGDFAAAAGCAGTGAAAAACLRALPVAQILQLQGSLARPGPFLIGPMVDGALIARAPMEAWRSGLFNRVPVIGGTVRDEGQFAVIVNAYNTGTGAMTVDQFAAAVRGAYAGLSGPGGTGAPYPPGTADRVLAEYAVAPFGMAALAYAATLTDPIVCRPNAAMAAMAKWVPVYAYEFQDREAPFYFPPQEGVRPLAAHTVDLQFLFPRWHGGPLGINHSPQGSWTPGEIRGAEVALSDRLVAAWTNFAATGNPNGKGDMPWPGYASSHQYLAQDIDTRPLNEARFRTDHRCAFWDTILTY